MSTSRKIPRELVAAAFVVSSTRLVRGRRTDATIGA